MLSASVGEPITVVGSLIVTVAVTTSPALSVLLIVPVALVSVTAVTVGAAVSKVSVGVVPAPPALAAASV